MSRVHPCWLVSVALLLSCEGLGRPVVFRNKPRQGDPRDCSHPSPRCNEGDGAPEQLAPETAPGLAPCDLGSHASAAQIVTALHDCTLSLHADEVEEREISFSSLDNVRIELGSRVRLRIADSQLYRVTLVSEQVSQGGPSSLFVTHTDLRGSQLNADQIELVSSFLHRARVESEELSAVDIQTKESIFFAKAAVISASRLDSTRIGKCDTLLLAGNNMMTSRVDACQDLTRIYDVEATACVFDGRLEADTSTFVDNRFGKRAFTQMYGFASSLESSTLCNEFDNLRVSGGGFTCVACQGPLAKPEADVCTDAIAPIFSANSCAALFEPPTCETFPRHPRPITGS